MEKDSWIHLKYALMYFSIILILYFVLILILGVILLFFENNLVVGVTINVVGLILGIIIYVILSYRALDKVYKKTKYFSGAVCWWIMLFFFLINIIFTFTIAFIIGTPFTLDFLLDTIFYDNAPPILLTFFIVTGYELRHKVRHKTIPKKPVKFFKTSIPIMATSLILIMVSSLFILANFFPIEKGGEGFVPLHGIILALTVIGSVLGSYLISCSLFYMIDRRKKKKPEKDIWSKLEKKK